MIGTNTRFTILDDESTIIAVAGHPIASTMSLVLAGGSQNEHPPLSDIFLHLWLRATNSLVFRLADIRKHLFCCRRLLYRESRAETGSEKAYWTTLIPEFALSVRLSVWPHHWMVLLHHVPCFSGDLVLPENDCGSRPLVVARLRPGRHTAGLVKFILGSPFLPCFSPIF